MKKIIKIFIFGIIFFIVLTTAIFSLACNNHAYRDCIGNTVYWFDSCHNKEDLYQNCSTYNLVCKNAECVIDTGANYGIYHYQLGCFSGSIYWYSSNGAINDLYKSCKDLNSCTLDYCLNAKCFNVLKCDRTTCSEKSSDYEKYCSKYISDSEIKNCGNGKCEKNLEETEITCPADCKTEPIPVLENISTSFFAKTDPNNQQWEKSIAVSQNSVIYFMASFKNNSGFKIDGLIVSANIPEEILYLGNLKIDNISVSGDIVSGIDIGSISENGEKVISFEGKIQDFETQEVKKAIIFANTNQISQSDYISINFDYTQQTQTAAVNYVADSNTIIEFLKRWYMWIIAGVVLVFLFIAIFKRLSNNV